MKPVFKRTSRGTFKGNVMTPLNWMAGICETVLVGGSIASRDIWLQVTLTVIAFLILAFYAWMYRYFAIRDPDRLQTEEFNLSQQELTITAKFSAPEIHISKSPEPGMISSSTIGVLPPINRGQ